MAIMGNDLFNEIKDIFDLPDEVKSFELRIAAGEVVTVKTEYYPKIEGKELQKVLNNYTLDNK